MRCCSSRRGSPRASRVRRLRACSSRVCWTPTCSTRCSSASRIRATAARPERAARASRTRSTPHGVQIMTPNYEGDPESPKIVPREEWFKCRPRPDRAASPHSSTQVVRACVSDRSYRWATSCPTSSEPYVHWTTRLGVGPFFLIEHTPFTELWYRGRAITRRSVCGARAVGRACRSSSCSSTIRAPA